MNLFVTWIDSSSQVQLQRLLGDDWMVVSPGHSLTGRFFNAIIVEVRQPDHWESEEIKARESNWIENYLPTKLTFEAPRLARISIKGLDMDDLVITLRGVAGVLNTRADAARVANNDNQKQVKA